MTEFGVWLHDNLKKPTRCVRPEHFQHREIGTEPSRRGAVLGSHMGNKFKGKWEMSKERGYASEEEQEESQIKQEDGAEAVERGAETNRKLMEELVRKEHKRFHAVQKARKRAQDSYGDQFR